MSRTTYPYAGNEHLVEPNILSSMDRWLQHRQDSDGTIGNKMAARMYKLGPRPPWWRFLARRRWNAQRRHIDGVLELLTRRPEWELD